MLGLRRRRAPRVLGGLPAGRAASRSSASLTRADLEAYGAVLEGLGDARVTLFSGEGSAPAALGVAASAVLARRRSLLLECDLAAPRLAAMLGLEPVPGIADYLRRSVGPAAILQPLVVAGPASGQVVDPLVCVVGGSQTPNGPVLLHSEDFAHAMARVRSGYDFVALAGPPPAATYSVAAVGALADLTVGCCRRAEAGDRAWRGFDALVTTD